MCRCQSRASLGCCYNLYSRCYSRPVKQKLALTQSETTTCPVEQQDQKIMNMFFTVLHRSDQAKTRYNLFRGFLCRPLGSITRDAISQDKKIQLASVVVESQDKKIQLAAVVVESQDKKIQLAVVVVESQDKKIQLAAVVVESQDKKIQLAVVVVESQDKKIQLAVVVVESQDKKIQLAAVV
ncbi:hypothetical protein RRG08_056624 [Elysia crispata]|uniref:Uncharacterized protein n=1 Tax=Elysia crispata TaxID=231223 RepID=A0AAE1B1X0_9GAST|nr:hypothetical protein RRG08_056624 [Elysia crispata]